METEQLEDYILKNKAILVNTTSDVFDKVANSSGDNTKYGLKKENTTSIKIHFY